MLLLLLLSCPPQPSHAASAGPKVLGNPVCTTCAAAAAAAAALGVLCRVVRRTAPPAELPRPPAELPEQLRGVVPSAACCPMMPLLRARMVAATVAAGEPSAAARACMWMAAMVGLSLCASLTTSGSCFLSSVGSLWPQKTPSKQAGKQPGQRVLGSSTDTVQEGHADQPTQHPVSTEQV